MRTVVRVNNRADMSGTGMVQYRDIDLDDTITATRAGVIAAVRPLIGYTGVSVRYQYYPDTGAPERIVLTSTARNEVVEIVVWRTV